MESIKNLVIGLNIWDLEGPISTITAGVSTKEANDQTGLGPVLVRRR